MADSGMCLPPRQKEEQRAPSPSFLHVEASACSTRTQSGVLAHDRKELRRQRDAHATAPLFMLKTFNPPGVSPAAKHAGSSLGIIGQDILLWVTFEDRVLEEDCVWWLDAVKRNIPRFCASCGIELVRGAVVPPRADQSDNTRGEWQGFAPGNMGATRTIGSDGVKSTNSSPGG